MSKIVLFLVCGLFVFSTVFAQDAKKKKESVTFYVEVMDSDQCVKKIEKTLSFEKGVTSVKCVLPTRTVIITFQADKTSRTRLASAFNKIKLVAVPVDNGAGCPVPTKK